MTVHKERTVNIQHCKAGQNGFILGLQTSGTQKTTELTTDRADKATHITNFS